MFPTDDGTGKIENRIKLIKADNHGSNSWNSNGSNNWAKPTTLNVILNETYWTTIDEKYQQYIGNAKYYLGGYNSNLNIRTNVMHQYERKAEGSSYYYSGNPTNWTGKIALMYASDYGYGANSACSENTNLYDYESNYCPNNNWLYLGGGDYEWLLPHASFDSSYAFIVAPNGWASSHGEIDGITVVRPVFYLTSDAEFNDIGDGSQGNPYQLLR